MVPGLAAVHADPLGVAVAFGAGMLSFLSPCVLPLVPGYLSMVTGLSAAELDVGRRSRQAQTDPAGVGAPVPALVGPPARPAPMRPGRDEIAGPSQEPGHVAPKDPARGAPHDPAPGAPRAPRLGRLLSFVAGFTVVFVALGASASAVGRLLLTHQHGLEVASGVVIVAFGSLLLATAAGLPVPALLLSERRLSVRPSLLGSLGPPVMGMAFAFAWTPCIGPVLGSVLALATGTGGTVLGGVVLLTAYSLGLGVPFLVAGLAFGSMTDVLGRARRRLRGVELAGGAVLVAFGLLLATGHVGAVSSTIGGWLRDLHLSRLSTS